ncbi:MAG: RNA methyltransferase [Prevotellaceae bacterium]|nr:RNA methyltransferase [Prevotellaceae bacterium]
MERIISLQNSRIKEAIRLRAKSGMRAERGMFPVEGRREISMATRGGYSIDSLFVCPELGAGCDFPADKVFEVDARVFEKIACREDSDGLLALVKMRERRLSDIRLTDVPLVIIVERVEKPGNLGAILRTADAAGADAVVTCDPKCDWFNPNVIRSSLGCVFGVQIASCSPEEAFAWLRVNGIRSFAAELEASNNYCSEDFTGASALIVGAEATGLGEFWLRNADRRIRIPMRGAVDSLNVSVSAAVITFEAVRQRTRENDRG